MHLHALLVILAAVAGPPRDTVPLYTDLGDYHVPITTPVTLAQRYFDQGMRLLYGFNHGEAIRSFNHAAQLDPNCAMCYWGVAYAYGPHVNAGMDSAGGLRHTRPCTRRSRACGTRAPGSGPTSLRSRTGTRSPRSRPAIARRSTRPMQRAWARS